MASAQRIPLNFLENILSDLRHAGLVSSQRGPEGGYWLARDPGEVTVADVIRAVEGPLATVRGEPARGARLRGAAAPLQRVWIALRTNLSGVLEEVTLADLAAGRLPPVVEGLAREPDSWFTR